MVGNIDYFRFVILIHCDNVVRIPKLRESTKQFILLKRGFREHSSAWHAKDAELIYSAI